MVNCRAGSASRGESPSNSRRISEPRSDALASNCTMSERPFPGQSGTLTRWHDVGRVSAEYHSPQEPAVTASGGEREWS